VGAVHTPETVKITTLLFKLVGDVGVNDPEDVN
jgi:hypothetical protein